MYFLYESFKIEKLKTKGRFGLVLDETPYLILSRWRELNPRPLPYQGSALPLSYRGVADSGFEPLKHEATDLQSVPFDRLGNPPCCLFG